MCVLGCGLSVFSALVECSAVAWGPHRLVFQLGCNIGVDSRVCSTYRHAHCQAVESTWLSTLLPFPAAAGFPILVIHGRNDKLAAASNAEALARRLGAPCVML